MAWTMNCRSETFVNLAWDMLVKFTLKISFYHEVNVSMQISYSSSTNMTITRFNKDIAFKLCMAEGMLSCLNSITSIKS